MNTNLNKYGYKVVLETDADYMDLWENVFYSVMEYVALLPDEVIGAELIVTVPLKPYDRKVSLDIRKDTSFDEIVKQFLEATEEINKANQMKEIEKSRRKEANRTYNEQLKNEQANQDIQNEKQ